MHLHFKFIAFLLVLTTACHTTRPNNNLNINEDQTRIAFGSCMHQDYTQEIWPAIGATKPTALLLMGDNVYAKDNNLEDLKHSYKKLSELNEFNAVRANTRIFATWDDHDYILNDGGREHKLKEAAKEEFVKFFNFPPQHPIHSQAGVYNSEVLEVAPNKRIQLILLDTRSFRSALTRTPKAEPGREKYIPSNDPTQTLLGDAQWAWLENELKKPAEIRFIVSSIQFVANGHGWEKWANLPLEQTKMLRLIQKTRSNGVVFLSGDRHIAGIYKLETDLIPYPIYDITASGLTHAASIAEEAGPNRIGDIYNKLNFGLIQVDWQENIILIEIRDVNGQPVRNVSIPINQLQFAR